jgi:hypothetical protein
MKRILQLTLTVAAVLSLLLGPLQGEALAHRETMKDGTGTNSVVAEIDHGSATRDGYYHLKIAVFPSNLCGIAHYASPTSGGTKRVPGSSACGGSSPQNTTFRAGSGDTSLFVSVCWDGRPETCGPAIAFTDT